MNFELLNITNVQNEVDYIEQKNMWKTQFVIKIGNGEKEETSWLEVYIQEDKVVEKKLIRMRQTFVEEEVFFKIIENNQEVQQKIQDSMLLIGELDAIRKGKEVPHMTVLQTKKADGMEETEFRFEGLKTLFRLFMFEGDQFAGLDARYEKEDKQVNMCHKDAWMVFENKTLANIKQELAKH